MNAHTKSMRLGHGIGKNAAKTMFDVDSGMVTQEYTLTPSKILCFHGIILEWTTSRMPCSQRLRCCKKSDSVNGDFSYISPSMKLNVYPWLNARMAKKQSSATEPSTPLSKDTDFSAPSCK